MSLLMKRMTSDEIGRAVVAARAWRAVRTGGAGKSPISKELETRTNPRRLRRPRRRLHPRSFSKRLQSRRNLRSRSPRNPPSPYSRPPPGSRRRRQ